MNLRKSLFSCLLVICLIISKIINAHAINDLEYFPYDSGYWWEYVVKYDPPYRGNTYDRKYQQITSDEIINGKKYYKLLRRESTFFSSAESDDENTYVRCSDNGIYRYIKGIDNTEVLWIKFPLTVGSEWESTISSIPMIYKVEKTETVNLQGRIYTDCVKITETFKNKKPNDIWEWSYYYAPKKGLVMAVFNANNTKREMYLNRTNMNNKTFVSDFIRYFETSAPLISFNDDKIHAAIEFSMNYKYPFMFYIPTGDITVSGGLGSAIYGQEEGDTFKYSDNKYSPIFYKFLKHCESVGLIKINKVKLTESQKMLLMGAQVLKIETSPKCKSVFSSMRKNGEIGFRAGEMRVKRIVKNDKYDMGQSDGYEYRMVLGTFEIYNNKLGKELLDSAKIQPEKEYKFRAVLKYDPFKEKYVLSAFEWSHMNEGDWKSLARYYINK